MQQDNSSHPLTRIVRLTAEQLAQHDHPMAQIAAATLRRAATEPARRAALEYFPPAGASLQAQLDKMLLCLPSFSHCPWRAALAAVQPHLSWRAAGGGVAPVLGAVELAGPDGALPCATLRAGFYYQPPQYFYPRHQHAAEEIYLPISGTAEWHADGALPHCATPGALIHHHPWQPHACRTHDEPLLALWVWCGNISMDTYRFCEE